MRTKWQTLGGSGKFFSVTKKLHNALQGDHSIAITKKMKKIYLSVNNHNASSLSLDSDVVVVYDPQPLPLIKSKKSGKWIWRCHINTSNPAPAVWKFLRKFVVKYDALVFSRESYIPGDIRGIKVFVRYPTIDPLSEKNRPMDHGEVLDILNRFDLDPNRPLIVQVSRFDPWKNTLGVIDVYKRVKSRIPELQLLLVGSFAGDDPEGSEWYRKTVTHASGCKDIHILTNRDGVGDKEVNAFQRSFRAALQLSIKEGFGPTVAEALWKGTPVVGARAGGITLQVLDGITGFLVGDLREAADRVELLLKRDWLARILGRNGEEHVRRNFLITKDLKSYLRIHIELVGDG
ncbi:MAG: glycosyltransferase [Candidatus Hadarchaeaceae archaeon]